MDAFVATARPNAAVVAEPPATGIVVAAVTIASPPASWLPSPPELLARHKRSRLANGLPFSGEAVVAGR